MAVFGKDDSARALSESHQKAFMEWLELDLEAKTVDLREYVVGLDDPPEVVLKHLARSARSEFQLPDGIRAAERQLFHRDFEAAITLLRYGFGGGSNGPGSSLHA
jgi:hypothetical protein